MQKTMIDWMKAYHAEKDDLKVARIIPSIHRRLADFAGTTPYNMSVLATAFIAEGIERMEKERDIERER